MQRIQETVIEENYKVTGDTRVITVVEHEDEQIQWARSTSISMDAEEPETLKEAMMTPNGNLWKMSAISEVNFFYQEMPGF